MNLLQNTYVVKCHAISKIWQGAWFDKPHFDLGKNYFNLKRTVGETFTNPCKNIYPWKEQEEERGIIKT